MISKLNRQILMQRGSLESKSKCYLNMGLTHIWPNPRGGVFCITQSNLFKTNSYKYDDSFGNEHTYLFSYGGVDIHPDNLTPTIKTCQESLVLTSTHGDHHSATQTNESTKNTHNNESILSMQDLVILHANNIFS
jgi:hypothetical protein